MKLYIAQHGDALSKEQNPERPLSDKGQTDVLALAQLLIEANINISNIIHSGKTRTVQTANLIASHFGKAVATECSSLISPNSDPERLFQAHSDIAADTLLISHMPFVSRLVSYLTIGNDGSIVEFTPGTAVCLHRTFDENDTTWKIEWMISPAIYGPKI